MASKSVLGIVLAGGAGTRLSPLTADRAKPAVPFGGLYRLIDFALSNLANGGIRKICVLTQYKSHSLDRHISTTWRMSSLLGNYVTPVPAQQRLGPHWYTGSADAIFQSMNLINDEQPDIVIVFGADHVYRMDPMQMIDHHVPHGAGVTVAAIPVPRSEASAFGIVSVGPDGRTVDAFLEKPADPPPMPGNADMSYSSMGNYVFDTDVLVDALRKDADDDSSRHDIGGNIIPNLVRNGIAHAYDFSFNEVPGATSRDAGYWRDVGSLDSYFDAHMDLCAVEPIFNLYNDQWPILTHVPSLPPAKFVHEAGDRIGRAIDSLVSPGVVDLRRPGPPVRPLARGAGEQLGHRRAVGAAAQHQDRPARGGPGRDHRQERHRTGGGAGRRGQGPRQGARLRGLGRRHHRGGQGPGGCTVTETLRPSTTGKLRVALLTREYPPEVYGGAGVHVTYLARELAPLVDLTVHCQGADRPDAVAHRPWDLLADANQALQVISADLSMAAAVGPGMNSAQLLHSHTWYANLAGHLGAMLYDIPHVMTMHSLEALRPWKAEQLGGGYTVSSWCERVAAASAAAVVAVSEGMRADIMAAYPEIPAERIRVIRNGIDTTEYRPDPNTDVLERYGVDLAVPTSYSSAASPGRRACPSCFGRLPGSSPRRSWCCWPGRRTPRAAGGGDRAGRRPARHQVRRVLDPGDAAQA